MTGWGLYRWDLLERVLYQQSCN